VAIRQNVNLIREIRDIILADAALIISFALFESGGIFPAFKNFPLYWSNFLALLPIMAIGVTLSFILHELMHKFVAQHYGAIAAFQMWPIGVLGALGTSAAGFLLALPGATMIYVHSFTKRENGIVSLAGPLTNFVVFAAAIAIVFYLNPAPNSFISDALGFTIFISIYLAFFNMLPIYPLDGSKVLAWNPLVYVGTMGVIFVLMLLFTGIGIYNIIFLIIIALLLGSMFRRF
jgi:Zn-dependent protease